MIKLTTIIILMLISIKSIAAESTLIFLNWNEYMDPELIADFEQEFNVKVLEIYYETEDERDRLLAQNDGKGYDLVLSSDIGINKYYRAGWVSKLNFKQIDNIKYIDQQRYYPIALTKDYGVPFSWGTVGLMYRKDLVKEPVTSWRQFFYPDPSLKNKLMGFNDTDTLMPIILFALGYDVNQWGDKQVLAKVEKVLTEQKKYVQTYRVSSLTENSKLVKGEIAMTMDFNGSGSALKALHSEIEYVIPQEGTMIWIDYLFIPEKTQQKKLAHQFINFINRPKRAAQLTKYIHYASANTGALAFLPEQIKNSPTIYPGQELWDKSMFFPIISPRTEKKWSQITARLFNK